MEQETSNMIYFCDVNQNLSTVRHVMANSLLFWIKKGIEELEGSWKWMKKGGMIDEKKQDGKQLIRTLEEPHHKS